MTTKRIRFGYRDFDASLPKYLDGISGFTQGLVRLTGIDVSLAALAFGTQDLRFLTCSDGQSRASDLPVSRRLQFGISHGWRLLSPGRAAGHPAPALRSFNRSFCRSSDFMSHKKSQVKGIINIEDKEEEEKKEEKKEEEKEEEEKNEEEEEEEKKEEKKEEKEKEEEDMEEVIIVEKEKEKKEEKKKKENVRTLLNK